MKWIQNINPSRHNLISVIIKFVMVEIWNLNRFRLCVSSQMLGTKPRQWIKITSLICIITQPSSPFHPHSFGPRHQKPQIAETFFRWTKYFNNNDKILVVRASFDPQNGSVKSNQIRSTMITWLKYVRKQNWLGRGEIKPVICVKNDIKFQCFRNQFIK